MRNDGDRAGTWVDAVTTTTGWRAGCGCDAGEPVPATVLDPFCGSGTTGLVALTYGRDFIGIDLSPEYLAMAERRIAPAAAQEVLAL
jgi:tRNA/tmRNA/rRNA uracil-C5-methylase (TrmA/RlmC/RlmD family)